MKHNKLSNSILQKIQKEHIEPKARWRFVLKNIVFWFVFVVALVFGSLGFSVILFAFFSSDFDLFTYAPQFKIQVILSILPFFWITFFLGFVGVSLWGIQQTNKGYKISLLKVVALNVLASMVLGFSVYALGGGERLEFVFTQKAPFYRGVQPRIQEIWQSPEEGRLSGKIVEIQDNDVFLLDDHQKKLWVIHTNTLKNTPRRPLEEGLLINILGEKVSENTFEALHIRPFMPHRFPRAENIPPEMRDTIRKRLEKNPEIRERLKRGGKDRRKRFEKMR